MSFPYEILVRGDGFGNFQGAHIIVDPSDAPTAITVAALADAFGDTADLLVQIATLTSQLQDCQNNYSRMVEANGGDLS